MQADRKVVIIDSDFLSSFLKIGKLALIKDFFKVEKLYIENFDRDFDNLGNGEKECIALCKKFKKSLLLTSDKKALGIARKHDVKAINIPAFLLACKSSAFLNTKEISCIIQDLKIKDYYEFSDDMRKRLL